jgi:hypothetical protein
LRSLRRLIAETATDPELGWLWAAAQQELGDVLLEVGPADMEQNLEDVIDAYEAAIGVYTPASCPVEFAAVQNNLGNAYRERRRGAKEENIERAISCYAYLSALTVRTRDTDSYRWARTQNNLGTPLGLVRAALDQWRAGLGEGGQPVVEAMTHLAHVRRPCRPRWKRHVPAHAEVLGDQVDQVPSQIRLGRAPLTASAARTGSATGRDRNGRLTTMATTTQLLPTNSGREPRRPARGRPARPALGLPHGPDSGFALVMLTNSEGGPLLLAELFADDWGR